MKTRIITGVALFLAVLAIFIIDSYLLNFIILGIVLFFSFIESEKLYGLSEKTLVIIAMIFYLLTPFSNPVFIAILSVLLVLSVLAHFKSESLKSVLPFLYPMTPIFLIWMLYSEYGIAYLAWMILTVVACDSGAYFVGKFYGKRAFSPTSPNKTWEGVAGGIFVGSFFGTCFGYFVTEDILHSLLTSLFVAAFGVWGDLFESYLKRKADVKDSGDLFPGHGGMLDRIDGYLFGVVAMLWMLSW
ncbi:phosphatidate cytidylyltransferase [Campylobacter sp. RM16192]|uniref:phosphatidate cytidylyltransferase n=1 Tax=Campylobacter sp. RM16192 TaxID=1660080 RepID=UPI0014525276|nr:phosphatidate cytidylyltransferase [Campylobacter sp. RM16192]QCD51816.1 CDP-diglyceride synthetase [Campylobacter sp. RM16192]